MTHNSPLAVGIPGGKVQRDPANGAIRTQYPRIPASLSREHPDILKVARQPSHKVLNVRPVVPVEAVADLRRDVGEEEGLVHGLL